MLNASVGVQRVLGRLRRPPSPEASSATTVAVRSLAAAFQVQHRLRAVVAFSRLAPGRDRSASGAAAAHPASHARLSVIGRLGHDRTVALAAAAILFGASIVSVSAARPAPGTGGTTGPGSDVRIAVGGSVEADRSGIITQAEPPADPGSLGATGAIDPAAAPAQLNTSASVGPRSATQAAASPAQAIVAGPFLDDGTLLKPVAVDTTVADGSGLMETYRVRAGDTLTGIASKFGVSMMTLWWANSLTSKDDLRLGQKLTIPPVTGLVTTVKASDTLTSLAARYKVGEQEILDANKLEDPNLVVGQVLAIPGAIGKAIPTPKPQPVSISSGGRGGSSRAPATYSGGTFTWPVSGGGNYISQYFHYGHYGIDIAADYGSTVRAAGSGTVIFAGWKSNGGGYQVWLAHGSGLYTTYNHMSAISVGSGQEVSEGQQVGRVGQSGWATGPHLHFEVWVGGPVYEGHQVNPLKYF